VRLALSECRRFVVADGLHVDREVFETLEAWAAERGLGVQDAIQIALCAFNDNAGSVPLPPGDSAPLDRIE
jgi:hypothetical protein